MDFPEPIPVTVIAEKINARLVGDASIKVTGINEIHQVRPGDVTFSDLEKYFKKALNSAASVLILKKEDECPAGKALLLCPDPFAAYDLYIVIDHVWQ